MRQWILALYTAGGVLALEGVSALGRWMGLRPHEAFEDTILLYVVFYVATLSMTAFCRAWKQMGRERESGNLEIAYSLPLTPWQHVTQRFWKCWKPVGTATLGLGVALGVVAPSVHAVAIVTAMLVFTANMTIAGMLASIQRFVLIVKPAGHNLGLVWFICIMAPVFAGCDANTPLARMNPIFFLGAMNRAQSYGDWSLVFWPQLPYVLYAMALLAVFSQDWEDLRLPLPPRITPVDLLNVPVSYAKAPWAQDAFVADALNRCRRAPLFAWGSALTFLAVLTGPIGPGGAVFTALVFLVWGVVLADRTVRRNALAARAELLMSVGLATSDMLRGQWHAISLILRRGIWFYLAVAVPFACISQSLWQMFLCQIFLLGTAAYIGGVIGAGLGIASAYRFTIGLPSRST